MLADAFGELGYRRATTAELASRCGVQENTFYRLWPDKKAIFLACLGFLFRRRMDQWEEILEHVGEDSLRASALIQLTGKDLGEHGLYRIIFAALSETGDPDIRRALQRLYRRYHRRLTDEITLYREQTRANGAADSDDTAWALIGLVAFMNIAVELNLLSGPKRQQLFSTMANVLLDGSGG